MNGLIQIELKSQNHPFAYLAKDKLQEEPKLDYKVNQYPSSIQPNDAQGNYNHFNPKRKFNQRPAYREQQNFQASKSFYNQPQ